MDSIDLRKNRQVPKGKKAKRGQPLIYDEVKERQWYVLTPTVANFLKVRASQQGLTASECLERILRSYAGLL